MDAREASEWLQPAHVAFRFPLVRNVKLMLESGRWSALSKLDFWWVPDSLISGFYPIMPNKHVIHPIMMELK